MSLAELIINTSPINENYLGEQVLEFFNKNSKARALCVIDKNEEIIGIIEKPKFLTAMSNSFGREIYCKRPIGSFINNDFVLIDIDEDVSNAAQRIATHSDYSEIQSVIATTDGKYVGIINSVDIYRALAQQSEERSIKMENAVRAANAALKAKTEFLAKVSHEIRTPLNGVIGMTQVMINSAKYQGDKNVSIINTSASVLMRVVNDILEVAKIEDRKMELNLTQANISNLLDECKEVYARQPITSEVAFEVINEVPRNLCAEIDTVRLLQAIFNLLNNAFKFTQKGTVRLFAQIVETERNVHKLVLSVEDTGIGMSRNFLERIFKPFEQEDNSNSRGYGGTGLGLNITQAIVQEHGGTINVSSIVGIGSKFTINIPLKITKDQSAQPIEEKELVEFEDAIRILVAEDNLTNQMVLKALLSELSLELVFANDGEEAVSIFKSQKFDLIFMDLQMPRKDGISAAKEIRELENHMKLTPIPIFALSANAMDCHKEETRKSGFNGHLSKPIILTEIIEAIESAVQFNSNSQPITFVA